MRLSEDSRCPKVAVYDGTVIEYVQVDYASASPRNADCTRWRLTRDQPMRASTASRVLETNLGTSVPTVVSPGSGRSFWRIEEMIVSNDEDPGRWRRDRR